MTNTDHGKVFIILTSLLYIVLGALFLINPEGMSGGLGYTNLSEAALTEVMASYGGLWIAIGFMIYLLMKDDKYRIALILIFLTFSGFAIGRVVGAVRYEGFHGLNLYWAASEVFYLILCNYYLNKHSIRREVTA